MLLTTITVLIIFIIALKLYTRLSVGWCKSQVWLGGKTVLITGGNSGLGYQTALILAGRGCRLIIADRDNCDKTKAKIIEETGNTNVITKQFNLASLKSVRELAEDLNETESKLDILINNAGTTGLGNSYTDDGLHIGMQVNHFGPFLLTHLLIKLIKRSESGRIIFVSSCNSFFSYLTPENLNFPSEAPTNFFTEFWIYANSKLCNIITANQLAEKLKQYNITVNSVHPGLSTTPIIERFRKTIGTTRKVYWTNRIVVVPFIKTALEGAQTTVYAALSKELENVTGQFFVDCKPFIMPPFSRHTSYLAKKIWTASENYVKLLPHEKL